MKNIILISLLFVANISFSQTPEDYGFIHLRTTFENEQIDILIKSKKGEEKVQKPILLFHQGSLAMPLIILYKDSLPYGTFPFNTKIFTDDFHLAVIGKPGIPLVVGDSKLQSNNTYLDPKTGKIPVKFNQNDHLDYYVNRNLHVINFLKKQKWASKDKFVIAGHSAGAATAAKVALLSEDVTHLIFASCAPVGRILSMIAMERKIETKENPTDIFEYWEDIVNNPNNTDGTSGDTYKTTYSFSIPPMEYMRNLSIPILVTYGTKDKNVTYNDYMRVEMIRQKKKNFTFKSYVDIGHNYFGVDDNGKTNYKDRNWDKVAKDWLDWINQ